MLTSFLQNWRWSSWRQSRAMKQILAWLRLLTNRLLQGCFCVLHLQFLSQDSVNYHFHSTSPAAAPECQLLLHSFKTPFSVQMTYTGFTCKLLLWIFQVASDVGLLWATGSFYQFSNSDVELLVCIMISSQRPVQAQVKYSWLILGWDLSQVFKALPCCYNIPKSDPVCY